MTYIHYQQINSYILWYYHTKLMSHLWLFSSGEFQKWTSCHDILSYITTWQPFNISYQKLPDFYTNQSLQAAFGITLCYSTQLSDSRCFMWPSCSIKPQKVHISLELITPTTNEYLTTLEIHCLASSYQPEAVFKKSCIQTANYDHTTIGQLGLPALALLKSHKCM